MSTGFGPLDRRDSVAVKIGSVVVGGCNPIVVQSMTNTDTADADATAKQVQQLAAAGSELVRITVDTENAAAKVSTIREKLDAVGCLVPLVGDFHYNGHKLLTDYPDCAKALAKYRINPGNVGFGRKKDNQFSTMIEKAIEYDKPVRIGVNWGSLDQVLLTKMMDDNAKLANPLETDDVIEMSPSLIDKTKLRIEGRTCFIGEIGLEGNQVAFQVNESIIEAVKLIGKKHG